MFARMRFPNARGLRMTTRNTEQSLSSFEAKYTDDSDLESTCFPSDAHLVISISDVDAVGTCDPWFGLLLSVMAITFASLAGRGFRYYYLTLMAPLVFITCYWFRVHRRAKLCSHSFAPLIIFGLIRPSDKHIGNLALLPCSMWMSRIGIARSMFWGNPCLL